MDELTPEEVDHLDSLLEQYIELIYLPKAENYYITEKNRKRQELIKNRESTKWLEVLATNPPPPPPGFIAEKGNVGNTLKFKSVLSEANDSYDLAALFRKAGLPWDEDLLLESGLIAAFEKGIKPRTNGTPRSSIRG